MRRTGVGAAARDATGRTGPVTACRTAATRAGLTSTGAVSRRSEILGYTRPAVVPTWRQRDDGARDAACSRAWHAVDVSLLQVRTVPRGYEWLPQGVPGEAKGRIIRPRGRANLREEAGSAVKSRFDEAIRVLHAMREARRHTYISHGHAVWEAAEGLDLGGLVRLMEMLRLVAEGDRIAELDLRRELERWNSTGGW